MKTTKDLLIAARKLIDTPEKLLQNGLANNEGFGLPATKFCSIGALTEAGGLPGAYGAAHLALIEALPHTVLTSSIAHFNDESTHPEVMALWDRAIAAQS